ncbi:MAG: hypothetical protein AAF442_00140 [Pseudomonadota bacterium]
MTKPIKITIRGVSHQDVDAPSVDDLLSQMQNIVALLHGVDNALNTKEQRAIVWRITDMSKNSPLMVELTPYSKDYGVNIDGHARKVVRSAIKGIGSVKTGTPPDFFNDALIKKAKGLYKNVTNGLAQTRIDCSAYDTQGIEIDREAGQEFTRHEATLLPDHSFAYRELGSLEGYIAKVELDGFKRPIVWLRSRLDGQMVKCVSELGNLDRIGHLEVKDVISGLRVRILGMIYYKSHDQITKIEVEDVDVFAADSELPDVSDAISPGFTGGLDAVAYLETLREHE